jgi:hypothetical protein
MVTPRNRASYNMINVDLAYCLLLDKRYERWRYIQPAVSQYFNVSPHLFMVGSDPTFIHDHEDTNELPSRFSNSTNYPTWYARPNAFNAFKSHKKIIGKAQDINAKNLLIVEDDIKIEDDFSEVIAYAEKDIPPDWDMIYFGSYQNKTSFTRISDNLLRVHGCAGWHCVLIRNTLFQILYRAFPLGPYDEICGRFIHPHYKCYSIYPPVVTQQDGWSYVENQHLSKPDRYYLGD